MANYIEKNYFNEVMLECIEKDKLTNKSIEIFTLLATEVARTYTFKYEEEKQDAIDNAIADFASNWRGYKFKPMYKFNVLRNFREGEKIVIKLPNQKNSLTFTCKKKSNYPYDFEIGATENKTLENLSNAINKCCSGRLSSTLHKVTKKICIIDEINKLDENIIFAEIEIHTRPKDPLFKTNKMCKTSGLIKDVFNEPTPAFNWATSVARNGIIKSIDKMRPKETRNGVVMNFSEISKDTSVMFVL